MEQRCVLVDRRMQPLQRQQQQTTRLRDRDKDGDRDRKGYVLSLIAAAQKLEKTCFPKHEAMSLESELQKRSSTLYMVVDSDGHSGSDGDGNGDGHVHSELDRDNHGTYARGHQLQFHRGRPALSMAATKSPRSCPESATSTSTPTVAGYMLISRQRCSAWLHKLCVAEDYRRRGLAKGMLALLRVELRRQNCQSVQLWVDLDRTSARQLYKSARFHELEVVKDYYSRGRDAVKMELNLAAP